MGILKFILRRLVFGFVTLVIIAFVVFAISQMLPSDPAQVFLGRDATPASLAAKRAELGLDRSKIHQFRDWFSHLFFHLDPGTSFSGEKIWDFMSDRVKNSLFLMVLCSAVSVPISVVLGAVAARRRDKAFDSVTSFVNLSLAAVPEFAIGVFLLVLFSTNVWKIFPRSPASAPVSSRGTTWTAWCCPWPRSPWRSCRTCADHARPRSKCWRATTSRWPV